MIIIKLISIELKHELIIKIQLEENTQPLSLNYDHNLGLNASCSHQHQAGYLGDAKSLRAAAGLLVYAPRT